MPVKTWVGRFAIVGGEAQEEGPFLRSFPRQRPDEEEDELYVLVEPVGDGSEEYAGQLTDAIGRMYRQDALSITGAVLRAIQAAHQQLKDWNARSLPEHRVAAGLSCLAVREHAAYLAQIGPSVAYHIGGGRFQRVAPEGPVAEPLGRLDAAEPVFSRYDLAPGDLLLIASPRLDDLIDEEGLRAILLRGGDDALVELFRLANEQQDFCLVLLACVVEADEAQPSATPGAAGGGAVATAAAGAAAGAAAAGMAGVPRPAVDADEPAAEAAVEPGEHEPEPAVIEAPALSREPVDAAAGGEPNVRVRGPGADIRYTRSGGILASLPKIPLPVLVIALIVAVAAIAAVCYLPDQLRDDRDDQFSASMETARTALDNAEASDDPGEQRTYLDEASAALQEAESLEPDSPEVAELMAELQALEASLDAELELTDLELIVDISERVPGAVSPKDLAIGGGGAYFLDREGGRVIAVSLLGPDPEPFVLLETGAPVGEILAGQPQHIAWAEDLNALLVLDDQRNLFAVTPPEAARLLTVRNSDTWGSVDGIAYRDGLFVLDRTGDQVWFYPTVDGGFDSEQVPMVNAELEDAVELAVGDMIYLVMAGDTILRFPQADPEPFTQEGIDDPLSAPASLTPVSDPGEVLVADRGNSRIVVFTPEGTFIQQFVSTTFTDLRAISVDEQNDLLYILVGGILYRTPLPDPPPSGGEPDGTPGGTPGAAGGTPDDADVLTYEVVTREDVSVSDVIRIVFRVRVSSEPTQPELEEVANQLIEGETSQNDVNALGFFFYLPDTDTNGPYTAGTGDWAPNGVWEDADTVVAGDYSTHQLTVEAGSILPP